MCVCVYVVDLGLDVGGSLAKVVFFKKTQSASQMMRSVSSSTLAALERRAKERVQSLEVGRSRRQGVHRSPRAVSWGLCVEEGRGDGVERDGASVHSLQCVPVGICVCVYLPKHV